MKTFYFTFGSGHEHDHCAVRVIAEDHKLAREAMVSQYGLDWAFQYTAEQFENEPLINYYRIINAFTVER